MTRRTARVSLAILAGTLWLASAALLATGQYLPVEAFVFGVATLPTLQLILTMTERPKP